MTKEKRIGILGGTFNPIHIGHLMIAQVAQEALDLDKVIFVPSYLPPHKSKEGIISAKHRFNMVRQAIKDNPRFGINDFEVKKGGKSYTVDTVRHFQASYPAKTNFYFIIGGDMLPELNTWKDIEEIVKIVNFIVVTRPGNGSENHGLKYTAIHVPGIDVSATYLRKRVCEGQTIKYLVPEPVIKYINKHNLFSKK